MKYGSCWKPGSEIERLGPRQPMNSAAVPTGTFPSVRVINDVMFLSFFDQSIVIFLKFVTSDCQRRKSAQRNTEQESPLVNWSGRKRKDWKNRSRRWKIERITVYKQISICFGWCYICSCFKESTHSLPKFEAHTSPSEFIGYAGDDATDYDWNRLILDWIIELLKKLFRGRLQDTDVRADKSELIWCRWDALLTEFCY